MYDFKDTVSMLLNVLNVFCFDWKQADTTELWVHFTFYKRKDIIVM